MQRGRDRLDQRAEVLVHDAALRLRVARAVRTEDHALVRGGVEVRGGGWRARGEGWRARVGVSVEVMGGWMRVTTRGRVGGERLHQALRPTTGMGRSQLVLQLANTLLSK